MNSDYMFLENFYTLLESGYNIEESLELCNQIMKYPLITKINELLKEGTRIEDILLNIELPILFQEYFSFFCKKNCISDAISKSLKICKQKESYLKKIKKQLTYPGILLFFIFIFSLFVIFILLPNVDRLFASFGKSRNLFMQTLIVSYYLIPFLCVIIFLICTTTIVLLIYALKKKKSRLIELFFKVHFISFLLKKYFSFKFTIYYQEFVKENMDNVEIMKVLNEQMKNTDLKIILYEINNRINEGEDLEYILFDIGYFDPLFLSFFSMYLKNPAKSHALHQYIDYIYQQIDYCVSKILKYLIPSIYTLVAFFVISIYITIIIPMMNVFSEI